MRKTAQKSLLITGCSSGIGYDAARGMARRGWRIFATCRAAEDCARLEAEGLESFPLDHTDPHSIRTALAEARARTGGTLDAVFANGGQSIRAAAEDMPTEGLREIFETNFFGVHELTRQAIPVMRAQGHGRLVFNSSVLGFMPLRWRAPYVATKYALEGYVDTLRVEMAEANIQAILIEPGAITSMIRIKSRPYFERWIDWQASPRRSQYETIVIPALYDDSGRQPRFERPAAAVTRKLVHALESRRPKPRYYVTLPTYLSGMARRLLSSRMIDRIIARS